MEYTRSLSNAMGLMGRLWEISQDFKTQVKPCPLFVCLEPRKGFGSSWDGQMATVAGYESSVTLQVECKEMLVKASGTMG